MAQVISKVQEYKSIIELRAEFDAASIALSDAVDAFDTACRLEVAGVISIEDVSDKYHAQMTAYHRLDTAFKELQKRQN